MTIKSVLLRKDPAMLRIYRNILLVVLLIVSQIIIFNYHIHDIVPEPFNPLREYPIQTVLNRIPGIDQPALYIGDTLSVVAEKCNNTNVQQRVKGGTGWFSTDPPGSKAALEDGIGIRKPGCERLYYKNPMPQEVIDLIQKYFNEGHTEMEWRLSGFETPVDKPNGVTRIWSTENFLIVKR